MILCNKTVGPVSIAGALVICVALGCSNPDVRPVDAPPPQKSSSTYSSRSAAPAGSPTPAPLQPSLTTPTLVQFREALAQSIRDIDETLVSLTALTDPAQSDLRTAYATYCDRLAGMETQAQSIKYQADGMRASREQYLVAWETKTSEIDNPTIRASAEARRRRLRDSYEQIAVASAESRDAYTPFVRDLHDIKKYLANDLSKSGVADLGDATQKVRASGATVKAKIQSLIQVIDRVESGA